MPRSKESKSGVFCGYVVNFHLSQPEMFYFNEVKTSLKRLEIIIYPHESTNAHKEMIETFIQCFDVALKDFKIDYIPLTEVTSTQKLYWNPLKEPLLTQALKYLKFDLLALMGKTQCLVRFAVFFWNICFVKFGNYVAISLSLSSNISSNIVSVL